jgi:hypothetical protein
MSSSTNTPEQPLPDTTVSGDVTPVVEDQPPSTRRRRLIIGVLVAVGVVIVAAVLISGGGESPEDTYLTALNEAELNEWSTERAAINAGYLTCERFDNGGSPRGSKTDLIAVENLCADYAPAFRVLEQQVIVGTFAVFDPDEWLLTDEGDTCFPDGGYGDINSATQVIMRNNDGDELARTNLGSGEIGMFKGCTFTFELTLTEGESIYILNVGKRGEISYTWDEVTEPKAIELSLGDVLG